jgi:hypothetical protein
VDALSEIIGYLTHLDLVPLLRVSRPWRTEIRQLLQSNQEAVPALNELDEWNQIDNVEGPLLILSDTEIAPFSLSALRGRHRRVAISALHWETNQLMAPLSRCEHLTHLSLTMHLQMRWQCALPPRLRSLHVQCVNPSDSSGMQFHVTFLAYMLRSISQCRQLRCLVFEFFDSDESPTHLPRQTLQQLRQYCPPSLTMLKCSLLPDRQAIQLLWNLPAKLQFLSLGAGFPWREDTLDWLTEPRPNNSLPRHLKALKMDGVDLTDEMIPGLLRLPNLVLLWPRRFVCHDPGLLLPHMTALREVDLMWDRDGGVDFDLCLAALAQCTRLETLQLRNGEVTCANMAEVMPNLTRLTDLELLDCHALESLHFLSRAVAPALRYSFRRLVVHATEIPPAEFRVCVELEGLRELELYYSLPLGEDLEQHLEVLLTRRGVRIDKNNPNRKGKDDR